VSLNSMPTAKIRVLLSRSEMTTDVLKRLPVRPLNRQRERIFFGAMALLMIGTVLLGFRQTYFPLGPKPAATASWVIQVHGAGCDGT
jgi:hypothetical protein